MKANRILIAIIAGMAIIAAPGVLINPVLAQVPPSADTAGGTTDTEDGNQGTTGGGGADDESPEDMYDDFQTCLEDAEGGEAAGAEAHATEEEIRTCFIDAGYIQGTDDDNEDEDDNDEENEDNNEETNN
jgi:hypothetical protein